MEIKKAAIVGVGALGVLFGRQIAAALGKDAVCYVADKQRIERYQRDGVYCNEEKLDLSFIDRDDATVSPADLLIFAVKYTAIQDAVEAARHLVGERTVIISLLNGITSEQVLADAFGAEKVLYCVAQGMDAIKDGSRFSYQNMGELVIGEADNSHSEKLSAVASFFDRAGIPYKIPENTMQTLWNKLMLNVGINQTAAVYGVDFRELQKEGPFRQTMLSAMRETKAVAAYEGITLTEEDISRWMKVLDSLNPNGRPSMAQDVLARRRTEVELFAGTITALGKKHGVPTPTNDLLYTKIKEIERQF